MTIREALNLGVKALSKKESLNDKSSVIQDARLLLLAAEPALTLEAIFSGSDKEISKDSETKYTAFVKKRCCGVSVSAITGKKSFYEHDFYTDENVLIPRPETEELVELAIEYAKTRGDNLRILDMCTGTGCIGLSIAKACNNIEKLVLADISAQALNVARKNAEALSQEADIIQSDLFKNIPALQFDIITSNPPYISQNEYATLSAEVKNEPIIALVSSDNGLYHIKKIITNSRNFLKRDGIMLIEIGEKQGASTLSFAKECYPYGACSIKKDLCGKDRILCIINTP